MQNNLTKKDIEKLNKWAEKYDIEELKTKDKEKIFNLEELSIISYKDNIKYIPAEFLKLTNLEKLNIGCSNLIELSEDIKNLSNLKSLYINCDNLKQLPKEICNLSKLEKLIISCWTLENFPDGIENMTNLKWLYIDYHEIFNLKILPIKEIKEMKNLTNLKYLIVQR